MGSRHFLRLRDCLPTAVLVLGVTGLAFAKNMTLTAGEAIFVTNLGGNYITIYDSTSSGDATPLARIERTPIAAVFGSMMLATGGLEDPSAIALDPVGNIYVANMSGGAKYTGTIVVFRPGAHGRATPIAKLDGPDTGLYTVKAIAVDSAGNIYATRQGYDFDHSSPGINVYRAASTGNAKPTSVISGPETGVENLEGIAVDSGGSIYVTNNADYGSVLVFPAGSNGDVRPSAIVGRSKTEGFGALTLDSRGNIYVVRRSADEFHRQSIVIYQAGSNGDVPPVATITGPKTGLVDPNYAVGGIAVDLAGKIYVAGEIDIPGRAISDRLIVYAPGSDGDAAPQTVIEGPHTKLYGAHGLAIGHFTNQ